MADLLKNEFNAERVEKLAELLVQQDHTFDQQGFVASVINSDWNDRELKNRMRHIALMVRQHSELSYLEQLVVMRDLSAHFGALFGMLFPDFVEVFGLDHVDQSLDALVYMTEFSSSEFAIRPYIIQDERAVMKKMMEWSTSENEHIRRLASEGCRPRLPWAMALPSFKKNPSLILPILENLKNDSSLYVRKSVANNINDITKDNADVALTLSKRWYGQDVHTNWIVKHGLRNLLKSGNQQALEIIGFDFKAKFECTKLKLSEDKVKIGDAMLVEFKVINTEPKNALVKVGYVISYMKSNGSHSDKIFHVTEKDFAPNESKVFKKKLSFKELTTRKHYAGEHFIGILVNGTVIQKNRFELVSEA